MKGPGVHPAILIEMYKYTRTISCIFRNLDRQKILQAPRETQNHNIIQRSGNRNTADFSTVILV